MTPNADTGGHLEYDELTALRWFAERHGFRIESDAGPYHLTNGAWSPVAVVPVDPQRLLKATTRALDYRLSPTASSRT